jgi:hypothetical protein
MSNRHFASRIIDNILFMLKKDLTIILDRSGSMNQIKSDVIFEFNRFLDEFNSEKSRFSLIQFNNKVESVFVNQKVNTSNYLNDKNFIPSGTTALFDAIGETLNHKIQFLEAKKNPRKVIIAIITDGIENSSIEYSQEVIRDLITTCKEKLNWRILFFGANQDSILEGGKIGIDKDLRMSIKFSKAGMHQAFQSIKNEVFNS